MATMDGNDPNAGANAGDWWSQNQPPATTAATPEQVSGLFQEVLGRAPNDPNEVFNWVNGIGAQGIDAVRSALTATTEGQNYKNRAPAPVTQTPNPVTPPPTNNPITGNTGAVPQGVPSSGFGSAPTPYASNPNAPTYEPMPTYVAPTWTGGDYQNPTEADLLASPGYGARLAAGQQARERSAAAQGTVLNGGTVKALDRSAQDYATNEYQTLRNNTYDAYVQKYKQFTDAAGMDLNARTINANENQNTFANRTQTYTAGNTRNLSDYITNVTNNRNAELDYWNRLNDVNQTGAGLAGNSR